MTERLLDVPGGRSDAERRFRAAIRAEPTWVDPYFLLASQVPEKEGTELYRQILRMDPEAVEAMCQLIVYLSAQDARGNAAEIVELCRQYRKIVSIENTADFEVDQFAMLSLEEAGRYKEAYAILQPMIQLADRSEDPVMVCAALNETAAKDFRDAPEFYPEVARFKSYCEERDHESASRKLLNQGKLPEAARELELQIATNPTYPDAFPDLAKLYLQLGQKGDAVRVLHRLMDGGLNERAKCTKLERFGALAEYQVPGDQLVDRIRAACGLR